MQHFDNEAGTHFITSTFGRPTNKGVVDLLKKTGYLSRDMPTKHRCCRQRKRPHRPDGLLRRLHGMRARLDASNHW